MFDIENTWKYGHDKKYKTKLNYPYENSIPVISGITVNNGVCFYTNDSINEKELFRDCLTISTRGEYSGTVTYHEGIFCLANNILTMPLKNWSKRANLYFASLIKKLGYGGYSGYPTRNTLSKDIISLPIKNNKIAFDYMENYIKTIEKERISDLEKEKNKLLSAYLKASNFDTITMTLEEKSALQKTESGNVKFKEFKISELFDLYSPKKRFNANAVKFGGKYPYVVRTSRNNGIRDYISEDEKYLSPAKTFSFGQDTSTVFYQENEYFTGDKIKVLKPLNSNINPEIACYFVSTISKAFKNFSWGQVSFGENILKNITLQLPVAGNNTIDYEYMENYIKAVEKKIIKNLIAWKEKEITLTKKVCNI